MWHKSFKKKPYAWLTVLQCSCEKLAEMLVKNDANGNGNWLAFLCANLTCLNQRRAVMAEWSKRDVDS